MLGICVRTRDDQRGYDIIDRMARSGVVPDDQVWPCFQRRMDISDEIQNIDLMARSGVVLDNRVWLSQQRSAGFACAIERRMNF